MRYLSRNRSILLALTIILTLTSASQTIAQAFNWERISGSYIVAMNEKGEYLLRVPAGGWGVYLPEAAYGLPAGPKRLFAPDGSNDFSVVALNNEGVVVGLSRAANGKNHLTIWTAGVAQDIEPTDSTTTSAFAINDLGHMCGKTNFLKSPYNAEQNRSVGFFYNGSQFLNLDPMDFGIDTCFGVNAEVIAINNSDVSTGTWSCKESDASNFGVQQFYTWQGSAANRISDTDFLLPDGINDQGQVLGQLLSSRAVAIYKDGISTALPNLNDTGIFTGTSKRFINNKGQVVGSAKIGPSTRAFLFLPDADYGLSAGIHDINELIDIPSFRYQTISGFNSSGKIAIVGRNDATGSFSHIIITPADPPPQTGLVVNSTGDQSDVNPSDGVCLTANGDCTLRAAIEEANAKAGLDTIKFNIEAFDIPIIKTLSELPEVTDPLIINGSTQPSVGLVEIDGSQASSANGLTVSAGNSEIRDLVIGNFDGNGLVLLSADSNIVDNLYIGADPNRITDKGNDGHGIIIIGSSANTIGALSNAQHFSAPNTIANNGRAGIYVASGTGNLISENYIFSNGALGIDLGAEGVTENDTLDADNGANTLANFPIIDSISIDTSGGGEGEQALWGRLEGNPNTTYKVEFFRNDTCDASLHGEGEQFLQSIDVSTGEFGFANFQVKPFNVDLSNRAVVTATATDTAGNTSEFSACWPQTKLLLLVDGNGQLLLEKSFTISRANNDPPAHTEEIIDTLSTNEYGVLDLSSLYGLRRIGPGDSIKISKTLILKQSRANDPTVRLDNGKFDSLTYDLKYDTLTTDTQQIIMLDHSTFGFAFEVAIEWDATREYIDSLRSGLRQMTNYLYDVTDGQAQLDYIFIEENQGRTEWTGPNSDRPVRVLIVADNTQVPTVHNGSLQVTFPRRFFLYGDAANQSAQEDPANPAHIENWRELMPALAEQLFGFESEKKMILGDGCDSKTELGFMGWSHPQFSSRGPDSEMSTSLNYFEYPNCEATWQFTFRKMSCWNYFQYNFEGAYPPGENGIFAPVIMPTERFLPAPEFYFKGPNAFDPVEETVNLQYDAASRLFIDGNNFASNAFDEFWELTDAAGASLAGIGVTTLSSIAPANAGLDEIIQGKTSDSGGIWLVGVEDGDFVAADGLVFVSTVDSSGEIQPVSRWVTGQSPISSIAGGAFGRSASNTALNTLVMTPIAGDFPTIASATLNETSFTLTLDVEASFDSLPTTSYIDDSLGEISQEMIQNILSYNAQVALQTKSSGEVTVNALDQSLNPFSYKVRYSTSAGVDSLNANNATSANGSAEFAIDAENNSIQKMLVISSPFTTSRSSLNPKSIKAGATHSLSVYPETSLTGTNTLSINYNQSDFASIAGAFIDPQSLAIHRWNPSSKKWEALASTVDTAESKVAAQISEAGTYALFTADFQTDINDNQVATLPKSFTVSQNYPNPFNPTTTISYSIPTKAEVKITIFNVLGQKVKSFEPGLQSAGEYSVTWDATGADGKPIASGMYFYKITAGEFSASRKMLLLK